MTQIGYFHIDAFADTPFTGNQAAVMPLDEWLADDVLQKIAEENNFAETAFITRAANGEADFELRWFTPATEVALCGHATLAAGHVVLSIVGEHDHVRFATRKAGLLEVRRAGAGYEMKLPAFPPGAHDWPAAEAALGDAPIEVHRHQKGYTLALYRSADAVRALAPDFDALSAHGEEVFIATAPGNGDASGADVVSRVFVPGAGIDEDSVTGAAHSALTPFWAGRLGRDAFTAYQASARGGHIRCRADGEHVHLGGKCVTVVEGVFALGGS